MHTQRIATWLMAGFIAGATPLWAASEPDVLAKQTTEEVVQIVARDKDIQGGDRASIHRLVESKVLPHFDFEKMTQLAVGKNWSKATPEQQKDLVKAFRSLLVRIYANAITSVAKYKFNFKPLHAGEGDQDVTVRSEVVRSGALPVQIDYRMEKQGEDWKVYDVLVDSSSLVTVYRNSFAGEVRKGGIEGLLAALARRNQGIARNEKP